MREEKEIGMKGETEWETEWETKWETEEREKGEEGEGKKRAETERVRSEN